VWVDQLAPDNDRHSFVAERERAAVGFVTVGTADDAALAGVGELFAIYLEPAAVGSGVGRALIAQATAALAARGFAEAILWVLEGNARARRFYELAGWRSDGARKDDERNGAVRHELRYHTRLRQ